MCALFQWKMRSIEPHSASTDLDDDGDTLQMNMNLCPISANHLQNSNKLKVLILSCELYAPLPNIGIRPDTITLNLKKKTHNFVWQFSMQIVCKTTPLKTTHEIFTRIDFVLRSFVFCCSQLQTEFMFIYLVVLVSVLYFRCDHLFASLCFGFFFWPKCLPHTHILTILCCSI